MAVLTRMPHEEQPYRVLPCDGSEPYTFVPDEPSKENAAFDIDIPRNKIEVTVTDAGSGAAVGKASILFASIMDGEENAAYFAGNHGEADDSGHYVIKRVLRNKRLHVCASRKDYVERCQDFRMADVEEKQVALALTRGDVREGRVITPAPIEHAMVMFNAADGRQMEWVRVDPDGSFTYKHKPAAGEIVCFASTNLPFYATRIAQIEEGAVLEIALPRARRRTFHITMSKAAAEDAFPAIALGDFIVPTEPLNQQIMWHGFQSALIKGWTITIPDILETAPIRVTAVPASFLERRDSTGIDPALLPEARGLTWKPLGESDVLDFP